MEIGVELCRRERRGRALCVLCGSAGGAARRGGQGTGRVGERRVRVVRMERVEATVSGHARVCVWGAGRRGERAALQRAGEERGKEGSRRRKKRKRRKMEKRKRKRKREGERERERRRKSRRRPRRDAYARRSGMMRGTRANRETGQRWIRMSGPVFREIRRSGGKGLSSTMKSFEKLFLAHVLF